MKFTDDSSLDSMSSIQYPRVNALRYFIKKKHEVVILCVDKTQDIAILSKAQYSGVPKSGTP